MRLETPEEILARLSKERSENMREAWKRNPIRFPAQVLKFLVRDMIRELRRVPPEKAANRRRIVQRLYAAMDIRDAKNFFAPKALRRRPKRGTVHSLL